MGEIAGPVMVSVRGKEHPELVRFYVASTSDPNDRQLVAEVWREALEADDELFQDLARAFYGHVKRLTAEAGVDMTTATMRVYPEGLHGKGKPS